MARDEEKANSCPNRWTAQLRDLERATKGKESHMGGALLPAAEFGPYARQKRPNLASDVKTVKECELWRSELIREVTKKIAEIQNAALGEHRLRDLNDEINKELREKGHWEDRILALGGQDHRAKLPSEARVYGAELAAHPGYKYFGAAKDLPGVKELYEKSELPEAPRKSRRQLFRGIQPDYYGWRDEDDDTVMFAEQAAEYRLLAEAIAMWTGDANSQSDEPQVPGASDKKRKADVDVRCALAPTEFKSYIDVPSMQAHAEEAETGTRVEVFI